MTSPLESRRITPESTSIDSESEIASLEELTAFAEEMDSAVRSDALISQAIVDGFHDNTLRGGFSKTPSVRMPLEDRWVFFKDRTGEFTFRRYANNSDDSYSVEQFHVFKGEVAVTVRYLATGVKYGDSKPPVNATESITRSKAMWAEYKRQEEKALQPAQEEVDKKTDLSQEVA